MKNFITRGSWTTAAILVLAWWAAHVVLSTRSMAVAGSKSLPTQGDVQGAVRQAQELLSAAQSRNWDLLRVYMEGHSRLLSLPDQMFAENPEHRVAGRWSFQQPGPGGNEIAFYSSLYVRRNYQTGPDGKQISNPDGFFIVGWKTGQVTQVPVAEGRYYSITRNGDEGRGYAFPGMAVYRPEGDRLF